MSKKTLYLDCSRGISGDMTVAALLDLGADETALRQALDTVPDGHFRIDIGRVELDGRDCCDFDVKLPGEYDNHDHDMDYLFGHLNDQHSGQSHVHPEGHGHRTLEEVLEIISRTEITEGAHRIACRIFDTLAEAEAEAHETTKDQVHFHEVGALDSIADIIAVAVCIDNLEIEECIITELCEGRGTVRCAHGILDIPVPAVRAISRQHGLALHELDAVGEYVTPTGAAVAAALRTTDRLPDSYRVIREGLGAGKRSYEKPGILRAMLIELL
ncbi:MAG: LarC family nickel insertion protein [Clostridia bacterium]|nr:LarC family nickel insertion protein [Clostridia bacterium]